MDATRVLLLRHGESTWNAESRWQGWADPPLSERGRLAARSAAENLQRFGLQSVVASDLARARETADLIGQALGLPPTRTVPQLRERNVGVFTGKISTEIESSHPGWLARSRDGHWIDPEGSETYGEFLERILGGVREAADACSPVLAVTHGGVLRVLSMHFGLETISAENLTGMWIECDGNGIAPLALGHRYTGAD